MTRLRAGAATDTGRVRTNNEDNVLVTDRLFAVADGMGGHEGGEVASQLAVDALRDAFSRDPSVSGLVEAVRRANRAVVDRAAADPSLAGMGTTLTAVALVDADGEQQLVIVNVGDSRTYLLRHGELDQLTEDDSLVGQLVRDGQIPAHEARHHPQRNIITRALGLEDDVDVDPLQLTPVEGERLLLCSDGLTDEVDEDEIERVLRRTRDPDDAAHTLVDMARAQGGRDNITVVVVDVVDDDDQAARASALLAAAPRERDRDAPDARQPTARERVRERDEANTGVPAGAGAALDWSAARRDEFEPPPRRVTARVVLFVLVLLLVIAGAFAAVAYAARGTYFVGLDGDRVTIYKGRPGGLLWFQPTVEEATTLTVDDVRPTRRDDLEVGQEQPTLAAARRYVENLRDEAGTTTTTTTDQTTTTTP